MTATVPHLPALDGRTAAAPFVPISVNLLPEEVIAARAGRSARTLAIAALVGVTALVGLWDYSAGTHKDAAAGQLASQQRQAVLANSAAGSYAALTRTKDGIAALKTEVCTTTTGSLAWSRVVADIRHALPTGVYLTGITATTTQQVAVAAPATSAADGAAAPSATPSATPTAAASSAPVDPATGSVVLSGIEATKAGAPAFALALADVKGLVSPYVTTVTTDPKTGAITFGVQVTTNKAALSSRYCKAGN